MRFSDKRVLVTGASRGIGNAIAKAFRSEGASVIGTCTDSSANSNDSCQEWIVANFDDIDQARMCAERVSLFEPDILINNAGINKIAPFLEIDVNDFMSIYRVNVVAPLLLCKAVIPAMKQRMWGRIVNISSIWGKIGKEYRASYSASKFAVDGMTIALAAEHSKDGIIANSISPGFTDTDMTRQILGAENMKRLASTVPLNRLANVDEIAKFVLWLSSDENTYIVGQNVAIDGGFTRV